LLKEYQASLGSKGSSGESNDEKGGIFGKKKK